MVLEIPALLPLPFTGEGRGEGTSSESFSALILAFSRRMFYMQSMKREKEQEP